MPVFNGEKYLHESVESILNQTFSDFEFLIMDDGSTDKTSFILKKYAQKDQRIKIFHQKNAGIVKSLNKLIDLSKTELIARMDADDISLTDRLKMQYDYLSKNPGTVLVGTFAELFHDNKILGNNTAFAEDFLNRWFLSLHPPFIHSSVLMRKKALIDIGKYREEGHPAEDYDLWIRIKRLGKIENINKVLTRYRINQKGISALKYKRQLTVRDQLNLINLEDIYQHAEIPDVGKIQSALKKYKLNTHKKYVIGKICCLTGCFLIEKGEYNRALPFLKLSLTMDKKRILDALPDMILGKFGKAFLISVDYSPFARKIGVKIRHFKL